MAAAGCYLLWGLVPLYWKRLAAIDPLELIAHRHLWSLLLLGGLLVATLLTLLVVPALYVLAYRVRPVTTALPL